MSQERVTLVSGWKKKGREQSVAVGFVQDDEQAKLRVTDNVVVVSGRELSHLEAAGLVESKEPANPAVDQTDEDLSHDPGNAHPGGAGHLPDDGYSNLVHVQREIKQDQLRGLIARAEAGQGPVALEQLPENQRRDGHLAEKDEPDDDPSEDEKAPQPKQPEPARASRSSSKRS